MINACISHHFSISGSLLNFFDYAYFFQKNFNFKIIFLDEYNFSKNLQQTYRNYDIDILVQRKSRSKILFFDIVFLDFRTLISLKEKNIFIVAKKLILFDNLELAFFLENKWESKLINRFTKLKLYRNNLFKLLKSVGNFKVIDFYITPFLINKFKLKTNCNIRIIPYFKKINYIVLRTIDIRNNGKCFSREFIKEDIDVLNFSHINKNIFHYFCFYYKHRTISPTIEMFGRLIFEFRLLGKKVKFFDDISTYKDGLYEYIQHYSLSTSKLQKNIVLKKDDIERLL